MAHMDYADKDANSIELSYKLLSPI